MNKIFKQSMEVGYYFNKELFDDGRTIDWNGSEECATFVKIIVDYAEKNKYDIKFAFYKLMDKTVNEINSTIIRKEEHMWDDYCKGFLAGEILGMPTIDNLNKIKKAEELWENLNYGYYQEALECVY